ncbi:MAG: hypothetical protein LC624_00160 [Halobacteriales archaeon]|nr:hypothetical protein [Halobacteriales archaeon]
MPRAALLLLLLLPTAAAQNGVSSVALQFGPLPAVTARPGEGVAIAVPLDVEVRTVCAAPGNVNVTFAAAGDAAVVALLGPTPAVPVDRGVWGQGGMPPFHASVLQPVVLQVQHRVRTGTHLFAVVASAYGVDGCPPAVDPALRSTVATDALGEVRVQEEPPRPHVDPPPPVPARPTPDLGSAGLLVLLLAARRR